MDEERNQEIEIENKDLWKVWSYECPFEDDDSFGVWKIEGYLWWKVLDKRTYLKFGKDGLCYHHGYRILIGKLRNWSALISC